MTQKLKLYSALGAIWAAAYAAALYPLARRTPMNAGAVGAVAVLFTVGLTSLEAACLQREDVQATRGNLRVRYSVVSVVASSLVTALWALVWQHRTVAFLAVEAVTACVLVGVAAAADRGRIKGIEKHKLFR